MGIRTPSILFRVFLFLNEFNLCQDQNQNRYPVESATDSALFVCNNRKPASFGLSRCIDVKDALLSLFQKGHCLASSTLLLNNESPLSAPRHVSMDATDSLFRMYEPSFHSNTPLLHPNSFFDSRTYSGDDFCSSQWSSDFSAFRNPSVLPAVSTSSIPTRPFEFSDPRGAEVWNQPLNRWDSQERSLRPSIRTGSLFQDLPAERRRSNSMSVMHSSSSLFFQNTYSPTPLSFGYLTPAQNALPLSETDALDDFSLGDVAPFDASFATTELQPVAERSLNEGLHLAKLPSEEPIHTASALNPNSAEFIPGGKKTGKQGNRGEAEHGKTGVKPRDLLEQTMLQQRIVENRITTLKLRGLPYTVETWNQIDG